MEYVVPRSSRGLATVSKMAIRLSDSEIGLLKELKGAGERGRLISGVGARSLKARGQIDPVAARDGAR